MATFACTCGKVLTYKDEMGGRRVKCPACNQVLTLPQVTPAAPAAPLAAKPTGMVKPTVAKVMPRVVEVKPPDVKKTPPSAPIKPVVAKAAPQVVPVKPVVAEAPPTVEEVKPAEAKAEEIGLDFELANGKTAPNPWELGHQEPRTVAPAAPTGFSLELEEGSGFNIPNPDRPAVLIKGTPTSAGTADDPYLLEVDGVQSAAPAAAPPATPGMAPIRIVGAGGGVAPAAAVRSAAGGPGQGPARRPKAAAVRQVNPALQQSFWARLPESFGYPFQSDGVVAMVMGMVNVAVLVFAASLVRGWSYLVAAVLLGHLGGYMMLIMRNTAQGDDEVPKWPSLKEFKENVVLPLIFMVSGAIVSFGPLIAYLVYMQLHHQQRQPQIGYLLLAGGMAYLPMAMLRAAVSQNVIKMNPAVILLAILRFPHLYVLPYAMMTAALASQLTPCIKTGVTKGFIAAFIPVPVLGQAVDLIVCFFLLILAARIMGIMHATIDRSLKWPIHEAAKL